MPTLRLGPSAEMRERNRRKTGVRHNATIESLPYLSLTGSSPETPQIRIPDPIKDGSEITLTPNNLWSRRVPEAG